MTYQGGELSKILQERTRRKDSYSHSVTEQSAKISGYMMQQKTGGALQSSVNASQTPGKIVKEPMISSRNQLYNPIKPLSRGIVESRCNW